MDINNKIIKEAEEKMSGIDKKMQELEKQNRKIFHPRPKEGIDIGGADGLEILDPEIRNSHRGRFCITTCIGKFVR